MEARGTTMLQVNHTPLTLKYNYTYTIQHLFSITSQTISKSDPKMLLKLSDECHVVISSSNSCCVSMFVFEQVCLT